jgi:hypothetical protein
VRSHWSVESIDARGAERFYLTGVSCPSTTMCVAVDSSGRAVVSTRPAAGAGAWKVVTVDGSTNLRSISCPDRTLCVAVDDDGDVVTATNPSAGTGAWTAAHVPATRHLTAVSCTTTHLCVATEATPAGGSILVSTNPTGGSRSWARFGRLGPHAFESVSCPSRRLCVASDVAGSVTVTTRPLGGRRAWIRTEIDPSPSTGSAGFIVPAVDCPTSGVCVAVDDVGKAISSTSPAGGSRAWTTAARATKTQAFRAIDCPTAHACVAVRDRELVTILRR